MIWKPRFTRGFEDEIEELKKDHFFFAADTPAADLVVDVLGESLYCFGAGFGEAALAPHTGFGDDGAFPLGETPFLPFTAGMALALKVTFSVSGLSISVPSSR